MDTLLVMPILIPLFSAILSIIAWRNRQIQRLLAVSGTVALLAVSVILLLLVQQNGIQVTTIGDWPAPFGIVLVADLLGAIMIVMTGLIGLCVIVFSLASMDEERRSFGYYPLVLILLMGVCGASLTGDIFNLYVWFEVMLITSFVLMVLGGERIQLEGAIKYFALNLLESAFFLTAVGVLYGATGTLNMAAIPGALQEAQPVGIDLVLAMMFLVAFGIKAALFPLYFWLPASYHTPPVAITTLFSGLMTKIGVYALIRVFTLIFVNDVTVTHHVIILGIAGLTMFTGVVGAVAQYGFRKLLSFHIISQIGYLVMGLGIFTVASLTGTIFFMIHVIIAKSALFLVSGMTYIVTGTYDLKRLGSFYLGYPLLAILFILPALSLAGIPPLSGFWAKFALIRAGLDAEEYFIVFVSLLVSILTLFSMMKIWAEAFWKDSDHMDSVAIQTHVASMSRTRLTVLIGPLALLSILTVALGIGAEPILSLAQQAAEQLLNPDLYIEAVLGP